MNKPFLPIALTNGSISLLQNLQIWCVWGEVVCFSMALAILAVTVLSESSFISECFVTFYETVYQAGPAILKIIEKDENFKYGRLK